MSENEEHSKFLLRTEFETLRDKFAMAALASIEPKVSIYQPPDIKDPVWGYSHTPPTEQVFEKPHELAIRAYEMADAMLAQRVKEVKQSR